MRRSSLTQLCSIVFCLTTSALVGCVDDATPDDAMSVETSESEAVLTTSAAEPMATSGKDEGDEETNANYCCQIYWIGDPQPFQCIGYNTVKAWARTKCYATSSAIPGTYPVLASGTCGSYVFCRGLP